MNNWLKEVRFRDGWLFSIVGIIWIWPVIHISICEAFGISTWRLGGWGMYATNHPGQTTRTVVLITERELRGTSLSALLNIARKDRQHEATKSSLHFVAYDLGEQKIVDISATVLKIVGEESSLALQSCFRKSRWFSSKVYGKECARLLDASLPAFLKLKGVPIDAKKSYNFKDSVLSLEEEFTMLCNGQVIDTDQIRSLAMREGENNAC